MYLGLERNDVRGTIPTELTSLLNLGECQAVCDSLCLTVSTCNLLTLLLLSLEYIALDWNALTGSVPSELRNLAKLRTLILARNALVGEVPNVFCERPMDFLAADCDEVTCTCCDLCCANGAGCAST